jgi:hypothetical protein
MSNVHEIREIPLVDITVGSDRKRALRPAIVTDLAESMKTQGQLQPIGVTKSDAGGFTLVFGRHRLEAAKSLDWPAIRTILLPATEADDATLAEIDENLMRADLTPAERAAHHAAREVIYRRRYPEAAHGGARPGAGRKGKVAGAKAKKGGKRGGADSYAKDAAKKTRTSERSVRRDVRRGRAVVDVTRVAGTSLDKGEELDALSKLPKATQDELIKQAQGGQKVSARKKALELAPPKADADAVARLVMAVDDLKARIDKELPGLGKAARVRIAKKLTRMAAAVIPVDAAEGMAEAAE